MKLMNRRFARIPYGIHVTDTLIVWGDNGQGLTVYTAYEKAFGGWK